MLNCAGAVFGLGEFSFKLFLYFISFISVKFFVDNSYHSVVLFAMYSKIRYILG